MPLDAFLLSESPGNHLPTNIENSKHSASPNMVRSEKNLLQNINNVKISVKC